MGKDSNYCRTILLFNSPKTKKDWQERIKRKEKEVNWEREQEELNDLFQYQISKRD